MAGARPRGWWYPWIFVAGMAVVVAVNGVMIYYAVSTFTGLETRGHYEKGLAYNRDLAAARAQAALGWQVDFAATPEAPAAAGSVERRLRLEVAFRDREGRSLDALEVRALGLRPVQEGLDREMPLAFLGQGRYGATLALPLPGQWEIRVHAFLGEAVYQHVERVLVP
jgi:nitrogen fixation protein FixH